MDFELLKWGDGTIRLAYWDSLHGDDILFVLDENGKAYRARQHEDMEGAEYVEEANLIEELRKLASVPRI